MELSRDIKNTYIKLNEREKEIWDDLMDYIVKKKMTVAEIGKISKAINVSINDQIATAIKDVSFS